MKLSVIVVNYKTSDLTIEAVRSFLKHTPWFTPNNEMIVVDNASGDGSFEKIKQALPEVKVIESQSNVGFSGGNNLGLEEVQSEYILLLNSDTISIEDSVGPLIAWLDEHPKIGIASCQLLNEDRTIQPTGGYFPYLFTVIGWMFFLDDIPVLKNLFKSFHPAAPSYNTQKTFYTTERPLDWVTGAFMLIRKSVIDTVGLLDEKMFMYAEEMEYCYRAKLAGFGCYYVPSTKIIHLGGRSSMTKATPILGEMKNILYFYKKHMPAWQYPIIFCLLKAGSLFRMILFRVLQRKETAGIYASALRNIAY